jgi:uncharacterized membrane protein
MLRDQSATCVGWQLAQTLGSLSSSAVSFFALSPHAAKPSAASSGTANHLSRGSELDRLFRVVFPIGVTGIAATEYEPRRGICVTLGAVIEGTVRRVMIAAVALGIAAGAACSGSAPAACPNDFPSTCPSQAPSFASDVEPLIHTNCTPCHGPGQQIPTLDTYANIMRAGTMISMQVFQCRMPPPPRAQLTSAERQIVLGWLVCGAMNN